MTLNQLTGTGVRTLSLFLGLQQPLHGEYLITTGFCTNYSIFHHRHHFLVIDMHSTVQSRRTWDESHPLRQVVQFNVAVLRLDTSHPKEQKIRGRAAFIFSSEEACSTPLDPFGEDPRRGVLKIDSKNHAFSRTTVANLSMNAVRFIIFFEVFGAIGTNSTRLSMVAVSGARQSSTTSNVAA